MLSKKVKSIASTRSDRTIPFPKQMILQIVQQVEEGLSRKEACVQYGMSYCSLSEWMIRYGSDVYHSNRKKVFSLHQKRKIISVLQKRQ